MSITNQLLSLLIITTMYAIIIHILKKKIYCNNNN